jgi:hypothetical protein
MGGASATCEYVVSCRFNRQLAINVFDLCSFSCDVSQRAAYA